MTFRRVPPDLYRHVEPEAGEILPVTRWRRQEEFCPNWAYIYSSGASKDAVVAALYCAKFVYEENWARALQAHAPAAMELLRSNGRTLRQYCVGDLPDGLGPRVDEAINHSLGGYSVIVMFPMAEPLAERVSSGRALA
jgi:hypothetical protein